MRGGNRKGAGRKPGSPNKETKMGRELVKQIRWTADEWAKIEHVAKVLKMPPSKFIREVMLKAVTPYLAEKP